MGRIPNLSPQYPISADRLAQDPERLPSENTGDDTITILAAEIKHLVNEHRRNK